MIMYSILFLIVIDFRDYIDYFPIIGILLLYYSITTILPKWQVPKYKNYKIAKQ